jgi:hypothetical protein
MAASGIEALRCCLSSLELHEPEESVDWMKEKKWKL